MRSGGKNRRSHHRHGHEQWRGCWRGRERGGFGGPRWRGVGGRRQGSGGNVGGDGGDGGERPARGRRRRRRRGRPRRAATRALTRASTRATRAAEDGVEAGGGAAVARAAPCLCPIGAWLKPHPAGRRVKSSGKSRRSEPSDHLQAALCTGGGASGQSPDWLGGASGPSHEAPSPAPMPPAMPGSVCTCACLCLISAAASSEQLAAGG